MGYSFKIYNEGEHQVLLIKKPRREFFWENILLFFGFIFIAFILVGFTVFYLNKLPFSVPSEVLLIYAIVPFLPFFRSPFREVMRCNHSDSSIIFDDKRIVVKPTDSIIFSRVSRVKRNISENYNKTEYRTTWSFFLLQDGEKYRLAKFVINRGKKNDIELYNQPAMDALAEYLAESFGLKLIDETGIEPVIRDPNQTDLSLTQYLTQNSENVNLALISDASNFSLINKGNSFEFIQKSTYIRWWYMVLFVLSVLSIYNFIFVEFVPKTILFWVAIGTFSGNNAIRNQKITITREKVVIKEKGKLFTIASDTIRLDKIERIIPVNTFDGDVALEFMGDNVRIRIDGDYSAEEAVEFRKLTEAVILSLNS